MKNERAVGLILAALREVEAIYLFGSRARGEARSDSDVDIAVLAAEPLPPLFRYDLQESLAAELHASVDLVDLRSASTVMRVKVIDQSQLLYERDPVARQLFEATAFSAYARLNEERRGIVDDIRARGSVYG
ncbi:MAG: type VII toxin-antitoxin system MntA family adenylyltransferase antitoxin [Pseudomonadales bacterium]